MSTPQRVAEIRNFNVTEDEVPVATYYRSQPNVMGGSVNGFVATLIFRELSAALIGEDAQNTLIVGNVDDAPNGWLLLASTRNDPENVPSVLDVVFISPSSGGFLAIELPLNLAKEVVVHAVYNPLALIEQPDSPPLAAPSIQLFLNGVCVATTSFDFTASSGRFAIGNVDNNPFALGVPPGFGGFAYRTLITPYTFDFLALANEITDNAVEIMKRGTITDAGLAEPNTYVFNPALNSNNGTPTVLFNTGAAANGDLDVVGNPASLVTTAVSLDWADIQDFEVSEPEEPPPDLAALSDDAPAGVRLLYKITGKVFGGKLPKKLVTKKK